MEEYRVLVVDDEVALLPLMGRCLRRLAPIVEEYPAALPAWERFLAEPDAYRLAVVDLTLGDLPGEELVERMLAVKPDLRVILISGYPFDPHSLTGAREGQVAFLLKPFPPRLLSEAAARMLQGDPGESGKG